MESNCLFGTYRASAARSFFLSGAWRYSATIRIDNLLCPNFIKAPNVRLSLGDEDEYVGKWPATPEQCGDFIQADFAVPIAPWKLDSFRLGDNRTFDLSTGI